MVMQIISLASSKGGVAKSTLAVNLAGALSLKGQVALSDEDITMQTSRKWVQGGDLPIQLLSSGELPPEGYRYWIIDVEGRPSLTDMVELSQRSTMLVPSGANGTELEPTIELWERLVVAKANMASVRIVITKAPPSGAVGQAARDHLRGLGLNVCQTVIRAYAAYQRAQEQRLLVREVTEAKPENAWSDILSLALEVS